MRGTSNLELVVAILLPLALLEAIVWRVLPAIAVTINGQSSLVQLFDGMGLAFVIITNLIVLLAGLGLILVSRLILPRHIAQVASALIIIIVIAHGTLSKQTMIVLFALTFAIIAVFVVRVAGLSVWAKAAIAFFCLGLSVGYMSVPATAVLIGYSETLMFLGIVCSFFAWGRPVTSLNRWIVYGAFALSLLLAFLFGFGGYVFAVAAMAMTGTTLTLFSPLYVFGAFLLLVVVFKRLTHRQSLHRGFALLLLPLAGLSPAMSHSAFLGLLGVAMLIPSETKDTAEMPIVAKPIRV